MVGYVLLISIAVALSTAVFFYLKLYLPSEKQECYQDIKLIIDSASCRVNTGTGGSSSSSEVSINFTNKGLFNIPGVYIKVGEPDRIFKETINKPEDPLGSNCNGINEVVLKPGAAFCEEYTYHSGSSGIKEISVQPLIWIDNKPVICPDAVVTRNVVCA